MVLTVRPRNPWRRERTVGWSISWRGLLEELGHSPDLTGCSVAKGRWTNELVELDKALGSIVLRSRG